MDSEGKKVSLDLNAVDKALKKKGIELPAGLTPGGHINTISVVPLAPTPTQNPTFVASPEEEKGHAASLDALVGRVNSNGKSLDVPDAGPFYGAKSAA